MVANGLPNPNFVWTGQRLRIPTDQVASGLDVVAAPANGVRWIEIDLTNQSLTAWQGDTAILFTSISSGKSGTPTVTGRYRIGTKYQAQRMIGPGYDLPNVPWVMYFFGSYAIHGAYWHNAFGTPTSHGCVNMRPNEAEMLYQWAAAGTEVYVHY
jgi:lipoprotein-anchoring transpeptidase ErfK/SrfK